MILQSIDEVEKLVERALSLKYVGYDVETANGTRFERGARICGYAVGLSTTEGHYIPVRHECKPIPGMLAMEPDDGFRNLPPDEVAKLLKPLVEARSPAKVGANLKFDLRASRREGMEMSSPLDVQQGARLLFPSLPRVEGESTRYGLKALRRGILKQGVKERDDLDDWLSLHGLTMSDVHRAPISLVGRYASGIDCTTPLALLEVFLPLLRADAEEQRKRGRDPTVRGMGFLWRIENELVTVLADIEDAGVPVDVAYFEELEKRLKREVTDLDGKIKDVVGHAVDADSGPAVERLLYDELGLSCRKATDKGNRSVDDDALTLARIDRDHPVLGLLQDRRLRQKLIGTYIRGSKGNSILENVTDGRVYAIARADGAKSGRFSFKQPNLTNIPNRTTDLIRRGFVPGGEEWRLVSVDRSQDEPRIMGHYSGAKSLTEVFRKGTDVYRQMAVDCGLAERPEDVDKELRRDMKDFWLGLCYRMGPKTMARRLSMSKMKRVGDTYCKRLFDRFFRAVPEMRRFMEKSDAAVEQCGYSVTLLGRKRPLPAKKAHVGTNHRIQGSAAELFKLGVVRAHKVLRGCKTRMVMLIHDDVVILNHRSEPHVVLEVVDALTRFDDVIKLRVPLEANVTIYDERWVEGREMTIKEILRAEMDRVAEDVRKEHERAGLLSKDEKERLRIADAVAERNPELADSLVDIRLAVERFWKPGESAAEFALKLWRWRHREKLFANAAKG